MLGPRPPGAHGPFTGFPRAVTEWRAAARGGRRLCSGRQGARGGRVFPLAAHSADSRRKEMAMTGNESEGALASVRYIVDDVQAAIDFYTAHLGFTVLTAFPPAFADVVRGPLRLLLSGPTSSGARATPADAAGCGRNRIHLVVDDVEAERDRLLRAG